MPVFGFSQVDKLHKLDIDCDYFPPVEKIVLFNPEIKIASESTTRIENIPTGHYTMRFFSVYGDVYDTSITFSKRIIMDICPTGYDKLYQIDSIGYNEPIVNLMDVGDTLRILHNSHGCFHHYNCQLLLIKHINLNYTLIFSDDENLLKKSISTDELKEFLNWEFRIKWNNKNNYPGCASIDRHYKFVLNHSYYIYRDSTCDKYGIEYILDKIFKNAL